MGTEETYRKELEAAQARLLARRRTLGFDMTGTAGTRPPPSSSELMAGTYSQTFPTTPQPTSYPPPSNDTGAEPSRPAPVDCPDCCGPVAYRWRVLPQFGGRGPAGEWREGWCEPCTARIRAERGVEERAEVEAKRRERIDRRWAASGIPDRYRAHRIGAIKAEPRNRMALAAARSIVAFPGAAGQHLHLWGPAGTGKSWIVGAVAAELVDLGISVLWRSEAGLLHDGRRYAAGDSAHDVILAAADVAVLVLDDLGSMPLTEWAAGAVQEILMTREERNAATLITSNPPPLDLGNPIGPRAVGYPERMISRWLGMVGRERIIQLGGADRRTAAMGARHG